MSNTSAPEQPSPWRPVLLLVALALVAAGAVWYLARDEPPARNAVPGVVRLTERTALRRLADERFTVEVERRRSDSAPRGTVVAQRPGAGRELATGSIVTLVVSSGAATTEVPDVTGMTADRAEVVLRRARLRADRAAVFSREPEGVVVAQDPRAGERADRNAAVRIAVSRGADRVAVPRLVGRRLAGARSLLRRAGLGAPRIVRVRSSASPGAVVAQSPVAGSRVAVGDQVRLNVSAGAAGPAPPPADLPHTPLLIGFGEAEAVAELEDLGFLVRIRYRRTDSAREDGTVVEQEPVGGAPRGSVITLVIGDASL